MDAKTMFQLSYGLYIIGARDGERNVGCVVNALTQATSSPITLTVCINKDNDTNACIKRSGAFSVSILSEKTNAATLGLFGFHSSQTRDKFAEVPFAATPTGLPYLTQGVTGRLQCRVIDALDNFSHTIFIARVEDAEILSREPPMTYAYYHNVIKGKTPPRASSFVREASGVVDGTAGFASEVSSVVGEAPSNDSTGPDIPAQAMVCDLCGYRYPGSAEEFSKLPDIYVCPICGAAKSKFSLQPGETTPPTTQTTGGSNMANLKGTKTEQNLMEAFAGESQARNKYSYFASKAKKDGYEQIAAFFEETAGNEKEHAKLWFKLLCGGEIPSTIENLKAAAAGENEEWTDMYKRMAAEARQEGFNDIAFLFEGVGAIEQEHEGRYLALLKNVENGTVFRKQEKSVWICRNCGHIVDSESAPQKCPVCAHPQAYFELRVISY